VGFLGPVKIETSPKNNGFYETWLFNGKIHGKSAVP